MIRSQKVRSSAETALVVRAGRALGWAALLGMIAIADGCSGESDQPRDVASATEDLGTIICGTVEAKDPSGKTVSEPEFYRLGVMNRVLHRFPEFAATTPMSAVRSCDDARAFLVRYDEYSQLHPFFDKDMRGEPSLPPIEVPAETADSTMVPKIFNGVHVGPTTADRYPVVYISLLLPAGATLFDGTAIDGAGSPDGVESCTGTFIAKNYILTAAHCFSRSALRYADGTPESAQWETVAQWRIQFPDSTSRVFSTGGSIAPLFAPAVTIVHPRYFAVTHRDYNLDARVPSYYDLGLLFIPPLNNDGNLPVNVDKSAWDIQKDEVTQARLDSWSLAVAGYGPSADDGTDTAVLNGSTMRPPNVTATQPVGTSGPRPLITTQVTGVPWTKWALCHGDSGGPIFRRTTLFGGPATVIVGVASGVSFETPPENNCGSGVDSQNVGSVSRWARVDPALDWMTETIRRYSQLTTEWVPAAFPDDQLVFFARMHGASCATDCDCSTFEFCDNSVNYTYSPFSSARGGNTKCGACDLGNCSCQRGQCRSRDTSVIGGPPNSCP